VDSVMPTGQPEGKNSIVGAHMRSVGPISKIKISLILFQISLFHQLLLIATKAIIFKAQIERTLKRLVQVLNLNLESTRLSMTRHNPLLFLGTLEMEL
jgi:hypothetical protein